MIKLIGVGIWVCVVTLASVYFSVQVTNEDPVTIEIQMLRKDEIIWVAEDTLTWASELPKEGDFESNIAGKAISIEVKEGTKKNRMLFQDYFLMEI